MSLLFTDIKEVHKTEDTSVYNLRSTYMAETGETFSWFSGYINWLEKKYIAEICNKSPRAN